MGAPDLSAFLWPDATQGRAPTSAVKLDRSNPLLAGLADYIIPADPSSFSVVSGTLAQKYDPVGMSFSGTMRLDGKKGAVATTGPFTLLCVMRMPASLSGYLAACSVEDTFSGSRNPWLGYSSALPGVVASNSTNDLGVAATASALYVVVGTFTSTTYAAYINGVFASSGSSATTGTGSGTLCVMDYDGGGFSYTGNVLGALAFNRVLSPAEIGALGTPQSVFSLFQPAKMGIAMPASSSGLTLALTGVSGVSATGSLSEAVSLAVSGASAAGSTSTLAEGLALGITQVAGTSAVGSVGVAASPALTNASATGSTGAVSPSMGTALTGASGTSSVGSVAQGISAGLTQVAGTSSTGSLGEGVALGITNAAATGSVGTVSAGGNITQALSGVSATSTVGSVVPSVTFSLANVSATGSVGSLTPTRGLTGASATGSVGSLTQAFSFGLTGASATSSTGTVSAGANKNAALTGVSATSSVGSVGAVVSFGLAGVSAVGSTGALAPSFAYGLTGSAATGSVGAVIVGSPGYPVNSAFYVKVTYRSFSAQQPSRTFYSAAPVRLFYIKFNEMLNTIPTTSAKDPRETVTLTFDLTAALSGATITSAGTPSITTQIGTDNPANLVLSNVIVNSVPMTVGGVSIAVGCAVQAEVTAGSFGSSYLIAIPCQTSNAAFSPVAKVILPMAAQ